MSILRILRLTALFVGGALYASAATAAAATPAARTAGDIDIFLGTSGGAADAPNVMFLIDNSANWSRAAQHWPDAPTQGQAEVAAISSVLSYLLTQGQEINVGLAMLSTNSGGIGSGGGYVRFGARNMTVNNNVTALQNILQIIYNNINAPDEKIAQASKDETAGLYEVYKYFSGLAPYSGQLAANPYADTAGNTGGGPLGILGLTAAAQGLTSGWAIGMNGLYQSPISTNKPCAANYIIYIANNANGSASTGPFENVYQPTVVPALNALAAAPAGGGDTWTDEWTHYFFQSGVVVPSSNNNGSVITYVLDAYNAQNNASYSASLQAAARQGGGRYYQVSSQAAITKVLLQIFEQIQSVNSTFASASLPVNATNRAQDENQVFVPMFRPDANLQPRWFGNLKQYQLINSNGAIVLGDSKGNAAINPLTGFPTSCAKSFWTTTSQDLVNYPAGYWDYSQSLDAALGVALNIWNTTPEATAAKGTCPTATHGAWDDNPDGSLVEKGGVAEVIRKGNNPSVTNFSPTWNPGTSGDPTRNVLTTDSNNKLVGITTGNTGLPAALVNWLLGQDVQDENGNGKTSTEMRPSIHGDEVHSRPLPIDYGSQTVRVFYGSNDGTLRAVDGASGQELWAFLPKEFYTPAPTVYVPGASPAATPTGLERLMWSNMQDGLGNQISPVVEYYSSPTGVTPAPAFKDYYYDGSIGLYEGPLNSNGNPSAVYIYPSMGRGGRMLYGLDVTNVSSPQVLWKFGCPHLGDDSSCVPSSSTDVSNMGQTWSIPAVTASVLGWSSPVVIVGAGYDGCEDTNIASPAKPDANNGGNPYCSASQKGAGVFVLDAKTGQELKFFQTSAGSVAGDVTLISVANAGVVDHAYAADTQGNVWRIDFNTSRSAWTINLVAYTTGAGRKFLFAPALLAAPGNQVYVALGSGDREHPLQAEYPYASVVNRFYVFKDQLSSAHCMAQSCALNLDGATMEDFTYPAGNGQSGGTTCSTPGVLPTTTAFNGWFINLNQNGQGEQTVTSGLIAAGMVAFSTNRPVPQSAGTCSSTLGAAYGYWLNLFNASGGINANGASCGGLRDSPFVGGGLPPSPVMAAVPVDGQIVQAVIGAAQLNGGTNCGICPQQVNPTIVPTRKPIFWKGSGEN